MIEPELPSNQKRRRSSRAAMMQLDIEQIDSESAVSSLPSEQSSRRNREPLLQPDLTPAKYGNFLSVHEVPQTRPESVRSRKSNSSARSRGNLSVRRSSTQKNLAGALGSL